MSVTARAQATAVAAGPPSVTKDMSLTMSTTDLVGNNLATYAVCYGSTTGVAPATYADLHNHGFRGLSAADRLQVQNAGGVTTIGATFSGILGTGVVGEHMWMAFSDVNPPIAGTVMITPVDLGVMVA